MSAPFDFRSEVSGIRIERLIPFYFDFEKGPAKKLREIFNEKQKRQEENIEGIIYEVAEANKCHTIDVKRRGKRKWLWGLFEAEPEERISISVRGHFCELTKPS